MELNKNADIKKIIEDAVNETRKYDFIRDIDEFVECIEEDLIEDGYIEEKSKETEAEISNIVFGLVG